MKEICCPELIGDSPLHHFYRLESLIRADHLHVRQKDATNLISGSDAALISPLFNNNYESQMREEPRRANSLDFKAGMCTADKKFNAAPSQKYFSRHSGRSNLLIRNLVPLSSHRAHTRISASRWNFAFVESFPMIYLIELEYLFFFGKWAQNRKLISPRRRFAIQTSDNFSLLFTNLFLALFFTILQRELIKNNSDSVGRRKYHSRFALVYLLNLWRWNRLKVALKLRYQSDPWHFSSTCPIHFNTQHTRPLSTS